MDAPDTESIASLKGFLVGSKNGIIPHAGYDWGRSAGWKLGYSSMNDAASTFLESIAPFAPLWKGVHISTLAVKVENKWVSFVTHVRATLVDEEIATFYAEPTDRFFGLKASLPFPNLGAFLQEFIRTGRVRVVLDNYLLEIYCDLAHAGLQHHPPPAAVGPVFFYSPRRNAPYDPLGGGHSSFWAGQVSQAMSTPGDQLHQIIPQTEIELTSSRLRSMERAYSGLGDFARRAIGVPYDPRTSQSIWDVVAPLPFGMQPNGDGVTIQAPPESLPQLSVRAFYEGSAPRDVRLTELEAAGHVVGKLEWPHDSDRAQAYLYYSGEEISSVTVRRWRGTENWRVAADRYFDEAGRTLEAQLQARGESQEFEHGIVRLLAILGLSAVWYGSKHFQSRPDLAAFFTVDGKRFVLIGECTGQKPSSKFTPLLARLAELQTFLGANSVTILPVVFTPCDVSPADTRDASHDGITIVGKPQLVDLLTGAKHGWGGKQVLQYVESLRSAPGFPDTADGHFGPPPEPSLF